MKFFLKKIYNYISDFYHLNHNDIFLFSYPKSGNTRVRLAIAYYYYIIENNKKDFDFDYLNSTQVEFGQGKIKEYRRLSPFENKVLFIKTHKIFDITLFSKKNKIVYIARPTLETLISYHEYKLNRNKSYKLSFSNFLQKRFYGANYFLRHLKFGLSLNPLIILYSNLISKPFETLNSILDFSGIKFEKETLKKAVYYTERNKAHKFHNPLDSKNYMFTKKKHRKIDKYFDENKIKFLSPLINTFELFKKTR